MVISKAIGEILLFVVALPLMGFQSIEMLSAFIEFASDIANNK